MAATNTDFGTVADDLRRAAGSFALLTSSASALGGALNTFREFEKLLVSANAIALGTVQTYNAMGNAARSFALATTASAADAVGALQNLAQAGFTAQESLQALTGVMLLASATLSDVGVASDLISSNIRAFGLEATQTTRVANLFTASITNSLASIDKLTFAMRQVAPVAEVAGLSIEETTGFLNELFNVGLRGEQAGTVLRNSIVRLVRPTGEAAKILREIGVSTVDATGNFRDLATVLREIDAAGLGESKLATIFENEALAGAITLMKSVRIENGKLSSSYDDQVKAISGTQRALELTLENLQSFDGSMKLLKNTVDDVALSIGEELTPYIRDLADYIRETIKAFKSLDPETQRFYLQIIAVAGAMIGMLATLNALILLFGGITGKIVSLAAIMGGGLISGVGRALYVMRNFEVALYLAGLRVGALLTSLQSTIALMIGPFVNAIRIAVLALTGVTLGPIGVGIAAVGVALAGVSAIVAVLKGNARSAAVELERLAAVKVRSDTGTAEAKKTSQGLGDDFTLKQLESQVRRAEELIDSDLINAIGENDYYTAIAAAEGGQKKAAANLDVLAKNEAELLGKFSDVIAFKKRRDAAIIRATEIDDSLQGQINAWVPNWFGGVDSVLDTVNAKLENEFAEINAKVAEYEKEQAKYDDLTERTTESMKQAPEAEKQAIKKLIEAIAAGDTQLSGVYGDLTEVVANFYRTAGEDRINAMVEGLANAEGEFNEEVLLEAALRGAGADDATVQEVLGRKEKARVRKIVFDLKKITKELDAANEDARIAALEYVSETDKSLYRALKAGLEADNAQFEIDLSKLVADFADEHGEAIAGTITQNAEGVNEAIQKAFSANDYTLDKGIGIEDIFGGQPLVDAIKARVDENTTPEQLKVIAAEEVKRFQETLTAMLTALETSFKGIISPEQIAELRAIGSAQMKQILEAANLGAIEAIKTQTGVKERIEREAKEAKSEADRLIKEARAALVAARKLEDALRQAAEDGAAARERYLEATRGFGVNERIEFAVEFDVAAINKDFDDQIRDLQRKIADINVDFQGTPAQLDALKSGYTNMISEIERARDAEIAAATSFTASMERRSVALDLFVRDLTDVGMAANDTFTQVGAGIASSFAEYQKELVTIITITQDATTSLLDTITTGVGDFIFENESMWETFKTNMLNISRQIFEGFTESLIQQGISSLTGGEGSILGNAAQPSSQGSEGTPSVGTGGILAKLFPGLSSMFGGSTGSATTTGATGPLAGVLNQVSTETQQVYQANLVQTKSTFDQFTTGMASAMQSVVASVQSIASNVSGTGVGDGLVSGLDAFTGGAASAIGSTSGVAASAMNSGIKMASGAFTTLQEGIVQTAQALQLDPIELGKLISYETGGTFNPLQAGPTTQWGQHKGLIQFGEPQAEKFGVDFTNATTALQTQLGENGAIVQYMKASGFVPGQHTGLDAYSTINAGAPGRYNASDANNGGAWGSVADKYNSQMEGHLQNSEKLFADFNSDLTTIVDEIPSLDGMTDTGPNYYNEDGTIGGAAVPDVTTQPIATTPTTTEGGQDQYAIAAEAFRKQFEAFLQSLTGTINDFGSQFATALNAAIQSVGGTGSVSFSPISFGGLGGGSTGTGGLTSSVGSSSGGLGNALGSLLGFASSFFSEGGYTGDGGKYEPKGIVHAGEYVTNAAATKEFYPLLAAINDGSIKADAAASLLQAMGLSKGYSDGGLVGGTSIASLSSSLANANAQSSSGRATTAASKAGDTYSMNVSYTMSGSGDSTAFRRSAAQHAKQLMGHIERAKKNN